MNEIPVFELIGSHTLVPDDSQCFEGLKNLSLLAHENTVSSTFSNIKAPQKAYENGIKCMRLFGANFFHNT